MPPSISPTDLILDRLQRADDEIKSIGETLTEHRVDFAKLSQQVADHERRGEERHAQIISSIKSIEKNYQRAMEAQAQANKELIANMHNESIQRTKGLVKTFSIIGTMVTGVVSAIWGFQRATSEAAQPAHIEEKQQGAP
jgi:hypothetical protein